MYLCWFQQSKIQSADFWKQLDSHIKFLKKEDQVVHESSCWAGMKLHPPVTAQFITRIDE